MSYRAIYAYAWDLADEGVDQFVSSVRALGIDTVTLAGAYHAGKFIRPKGRSGKVYFPEDGTAYFRFDPERYGTIAPVLSKLASETDVMGALCRRSDIAVNVWLALLHNTRLGTAHPEVTVENAFGDRYPYSLCPSAPEARAYAVALCRDVTDSYPVIGLSLETPGFLPYVHGFHHEFALIRQNRWLNDQLGLCFCRHCQAGARAAGIDAEGLRTRLRTDIEAYLDSGIDFPDDMAEAFWLADTRSDGALGAFLAWRCTVVTSLVAEIRAAVRRDAAIAVIPSVARPSGGAWYEGSDLPALAETAGVIEACFYEPTAERVRADLFDLNRRLRGKGALRGILRPAFPDLQSKASLVAAAEALREGEVAGIAFYNYGHLRRPNLGWIADAIAAFGG
ncbi:MAG: hypothetical protein QOK29_1612 [Rhodospirillaceae bacterium]|nr:hypothetical protein [Rhodospirillaceae bacterium]